MKVKYINDVPRNIKAIAFLSSAEPEKSNFNLLFLIIPVAILFLIKGKK